MTPLKQQKHDENGNKLDAMIVIYLCDNGQGIPLNNNLQYKDKYLTKDSDSEE